MNLLPKLSIWNTRAIAHVQILTGQNTWHHQLPPWIVQMVFWNSGPWKIQIRVSIKCLIWPVEFRHGKSYFSDMEKWKCVPNSATDKVCGLLSGWCPKMEVPVGLPEANLKFIVSESISVQELLMGITKSNFLMLADSVYSPAIFPVLTLPSRPPKVL